MPKGGGSDDDLLLLRPESPSVQDRPFPLPISPPRSRGQEIAQGLGFRPPKKQPSAPPARRNSQAAMRARGGGGLRMGAAAITLPDPKSSPKSSKEQDNDDDDTASDGEINDLDRARSLSLALLSPPSTRPLRHHRGRAGKSFII